MSVARKIVFFLSLLALAICSAFLLAESAVEECVSVLCSGWGTQSYEAVGVGSDGLAAVAGWNGDRLELQVFGLDGAEAEKWSVKLPGQEGGSIASLYPCREDLVMLGIYSPDARTLSVYRLTKEGDAETLLQEKCRGTSSVERRNGTRLSVFSQDGSKVSFAVLSGSKVTGYAGAMEEGGLVEIASSSLGDASCAAVLPDGTLVMGGTGSLVMAGQSNPNVAQSEMVTQLTRRGINLYYLDGTNLSVHYSDLTNNTVRRVLSLEEAVQGHRLNSFSLTAEGGALVLLDGHILRLVTEDGIRDLKGVIYPTAVYSMTVLVLLLAAALLAALVVWYLICGRIQGWSPMAVHWGCLLAALALCSALVMEYGLFQPQQKQEIQQERSRMVDGVFQVALSQYEMSDQALPSVLTAALEGIRDSGCQDITAASVSLTQEGVWRLADGRRAELEPGFDAALAEAAAQTGIAWMENGNRFLCCLRDGSQMVVVSLDELTRPRGAAALFGSTALVTLAAILIFLTVGRSVRRLTRAATSLIAEGGRLRLGTGDELAVMATALSSTADALASQARAREELEQSYRRFVPEKLLTLLGKQSIQQVDKSTFASRRMAVMMIWFQFPEPLYTQAANSRLLFDSVNQLIERTASQASKKGGTVFRFSYDGYDVVMENDSEQVISTAVAIQQEVLAFNEGRIRDGLPGVKFHIALDVGDVLLGVVGDSTQIEPTTISTSFSVVRELVRLSDQLDACILCTESIIGGAGQYGSRYMGKCWLDGDAIRVYEIFDGDEYGVRKGKAQTVELFSQGVYALYSGETGQAKRTFLELVHDNPADGGARYYLYLADRMERDPGLVCGLNPQWDHQRRE